MGEPTNRPVLRVIAGNPSPDEVAVVVAVLSAVAAGGAEPAPPARLDAWSDRSRGLGAVPAPGPNTWRLSGLPG